MRRTVITIPGSEAVGATRRRGTTLLELLIVIGVIGIMITMMLPSMRRSMEMASSAMCMHNLRSIGQALIQYQTENDGWLPTNTELPSTLAGGAPSGDSWFTKLFPTHLNDPMIFTCPEDPFRYRMAKVRNNLDDPSITDYPSFGLNGFILTAGGGQLADLARYKPSRPLNVILAADLGPDDANRVKTVGSGPKRNKSYLSWDDGYDPFLMQSSPWLTTRHGRGINVLTLEGGVRQAQTYDMMRKPIRGYYSECAAGQCSLCLDGVVIRNYQHYSFAKDSLYWWTGTVAID